MSRVKIAVLFRGPVRPGVGDVVQRCSEFMQQFQSVTNATVCTYLATWRNWKQQRASDLMAMDLFDNVIMQTEPTDEQIQRATTIKNLPNGAEIRPVFNMYYQSKTAMELIQQADDYDFIVHSRTDIVMQFGQFLPDWFSSTAYSAPHVHGVLAPHAPHVPAEEQWMCDQFGIARADMMRAAWDYGTIQDLGRRIEAADIPERVLQTMIDERNIPVLAPKYVAWQLDPRRNW
jgi:hypothetical protein